MNGQENLFDRADLENLRKIIAGASINGIESAKYLIALDKKLEDAITNYDDTPF